MQMLKNIAVGLVGLFVMGVLFRLAWLVAGFLLRLLFTLLIFVVLCGLVLYFYRQLKGGGTA